MSSCHAFPSKQLSRGRCLSIAALHLQMIRRFDSVPRHAHQAILKLRGAILNHECRGEIIVSLQTVHTAVENAHHLAFIGLTLDMLANEELLCVMPSLKVEHWTNILILPGDNRQSTPQSIQADSGRSQYVQLRKVQNCFSPTSRWASPSQNPAS